MRLSRTTYREFVRIQQLQEQLEVLQDEHRDLYRGADYSPLGHEYDLRYIADKRNKNLPNVNSARDPYGLIALSLLGLVAIGLLAQRVIPMLIMGLGW